MDSFWRILGFNNESNCNDISNANNLDAADQPIEEAISESNINMEIDNMDAVDGVESIDRVIQAAISNESYSNMVIDDVADHNIQAAVNNGSKKRPREIFESIAREVEFLAGKRQCNKYLASRLLKPELKSYEPNPYTAGGPDFLTAPHQSDYVDYGIIATNKYFNFFMNDQFERHMNVNRFQLCPRLMQTFAVDMVSRSIDRKLNFIVRNQDSILMKKKMQEKK
jgi:hypothetical protein